jgi:sec-independent protein translocase protein TatA
MADGVNMLLGFIGPTEIVVILVIALLVFGPNKLPEIGKQVGHAYRELNKMRGDVQRALDIDVYGNNHNNGSYDLPSYNGDSNYNNNYSNSSSPTRNGSDDYTYTYGDYNDEDHEQKSIAEHTMPPGFVAPPGPVAAQAAALVTTPNTTEAGDTEHSNGAAAHTGAYEDFGIHSANGNGAGVPATSPAVQSVAAGADSKEQ